MEVSNETNAVRESWEEWQRKFASAGQIITAAAEKYRGPEQIALRHRVNEAWEELTYEGLAALARQAARALIALGVAEAGPRDEKMEFSGDGSPLVGICCANRMEAVAVDYACALARAVSLPLYANVSLEDFKHIVEHSGVQILIVDDWTRYRKVLAVLKANESLRHIIVIDPEVRLKKDERMMNWADFLARGTAEGLAAEAEARQRRAGPEDITVVHYTSGTTGPPKGVLLTHRAILTAIYNLGQAELPAAHEVRLSLLPLAHPLERAAGYLTHLSGGRLDLCPEAEAIPACLQESQPHYLNSLPRMWEKIHNTLLMAMTLAPGYRQRFFKQGLRTGARYQRALRQEAPLSPWLNLRHNLAHYFILIKIQAAFGGRLKQSCCLGAALDPAVEEFFDSAGIAVRPGYSLAECPLAAIASGRAPGFGTCGTAVAELKTTAEQELCLRGPTVASGYYRDPARTARSFTPDGWFLSGDRGLIDEAQQVTVLGRQAHLLPDRAGPERSPEQIEKRLKGDYYIDDIMIAADPAGALTAIIVPNFDGLQFYFSQQEKSFADRAALLNDPDVPALYYRQWAEKAPATKVAALSILAEPFTVEGGELNPLQLLKREAIAAKYGGSDK